jgi:hypothetical protein
MHVICDYCGRGYDDAHRWTICPHRSLWQQPLPEGEKPMNNGPKIAPTVGRVVWYFTHPDDREFGDTRGEPLAAIVVHVLREDLVSLTVYDQAGLPRPRRCVPLIQANEPKPHTRSYCTWMPFQVGQAAKTAELEALAKPEARE